MVAPGSLARPLPAAAKIGARHRERRAYIYVRQSTPSQVRRNQAGRDNQYALTERALALGWLPERIHVIDADLGQSGRERDRRGFQQLVAEVSLGRVGLVLAFEASRLARNNADWYELLDLAALVGTLIADPAGVYDPRDYNDRLLLGLRGMFSEAELHLLRARLDAGRLRQVAQGIYRQHLPTGLVRLPDGRVVKDPDQQVQHALELVFARFAALGSAHRVMRSLAAEGIRLPRRQTGGARAGDLVWRRPSAAMVLAILRNPAYAGAFAYGRRGLAADPRPGRPRVVQHPPEAWTALRHGMYPAYISWEQYMANRERLADNRYRFARRARGAPRAGKALLAGLAVCGRCGGKMGVRYKTGTHSLCASRRESHALPARLKMDGAGVEAAVTAAFFEALQPAELALLEEGLAAAQEERALRARQHADQVARAAYEARLAERQYQAVDPDNRLVAAELERRWEVALRALAEAREAAERFAQGAPAPALDPALVAQLRDLHTALPALWHSGRLSPAQQKELLRALIRRVVLSRPARERIEVAIVWVSGALTRLTVRPPLNRSADLEAYDRIVARVSALAAAGYQDRAIARQLAAEGFRSARRTTLPLSLVRTIRSATGATSLTQQLRGQDRVDDRWTVGGLARHLRVGRSWVYQRLADGRIPADRHPVTGHYLIPDDPALFARLPRRPFQRKANGLT